MIRSNKTFFRLQFFTRKKEDEKVFAQSKHLHKHVEKISISKAVDVLSTCTHNYTPHTRTHIHTTETQINLL